MNETIYQQAREAAVADAMAVLFPNGAGQINHIHAEHYLDKVSRQSFEAGRQYALLGLMTSDDVAGHFGISKRRANALIANRHQRFAVGMKIGNQWLIHRDELADIAPDEKYRADIVFLTFSCPQCAASISARDTVDARTTLGSWHVDCPRCGTRVQPTAVITDDGSTLTAEP